MLKKPDIWNVGQLPTEWGNNRGIPPSAWRIDTSSPNAWNAVMELPSIWNSHSGIIETWNNKNLSAEWKQTAGIPENWGTSTVVKKSNTAGGFSLNLGAAARKASDAAGKIGNMAKGAASSAIGVLKSEETANKLNSLKGKAAAVAGSAGAAASGAKNKLSGMASSLAERRKMSQNSGNITEEDVVSADTAYNEELIGTDEYINNDVNYTENPQASEAVEIPDEYLQTEEAFPVPIANTYNATEKSTDGNYQNNTTQNQFYNERINEYQQSPQYVREEQRLAQQNYYNNGNSNQLYPNYYIPRYVIQERKSYIIPILIGIIIVGVSVAGILSGMLIMKNKNDKNNDKGNNSISNSYNNSYSNVDGSTTELSTDEATASESITKPSTEETIVEDQFTADEVSAMYSDHINKNPDPNKTIGSGYALIDLNDDGIQEILITGDDSESGSPKILGIYMASGRQLKELWTPAPGFAGILCEDNILSAFTALGQGGGTALYKYNSASRFDLIDMVSYDYSSGSKVMYHNHEVISEAEADSILAQYKPKKFEAKPLSIQSQQAEQPTEAPTTKKTSSLSEQELGYMYNLFYIEAVHGYVGGGYIYDYDDDGTDEVVLSYANGGYQIVKYQNGELYRSPYPNGSNYTDGQKLPDITAVYYDYSSISDKLCELAQAHGFSANVNFKRGSSNLLGYVKTSDIFSTLNLRSAPSTYSKVLTQLPSGTLFNVVTVYDNNGNETYIHYDYAWLLIDVNINGSSYTGYISAEYAVAWDDGI